MKSMNNLTNIINNLQESYYNDEGLFLSKKTMLPERESFNRIFKSCEHLFFPNYWKDASSTDNSHRLQIVLAGLYEYFSVGLSSYGISQENVNSFLESFFEEKFVSIREDLMLDVKAAFGGDPAAKDYTSIIRAYPGFQAILMHRVSHEFYKEGDGFSQYARELSESIHSKVGIDIHPGAQIGKYFFMDHGTGIVIGETAIIGNHVRLYQNVTLGALHFEEDDNGNLKKDYKRHPTLGNHIVVGDSASVLGDITIGDYVKIGANSTVTKPVDANMTVYPKPSHVSKYNAEKND